LRNWKREAGVASSILALLILLAWLAPGYFSASNIRDVSLANAPVLIVALGMTVVILCGEIDISVGSTFAIASVAAGLFSKLGSPVLVAICGACFVGALLGAVNGALVAFVRIPSIVVTLAAMVALRDALRWVTGGAWVEDLPANFQWIGLPQDLYPWVILATSASLAVLFGWVLQNLRAGRAIYAAGSNPEAARLCGIPTSKVRLWAFVTVGLLTGLAASLNATRFNQIPSNTGLGLEMKVIAAVVVGGTAIRGGRGRIVGTVLGVVLLGAIGPALTFLGVNAYWEKAIQGGIILLAILPGVARFGLSQRAVGPHAVG
jgi:rhamnose transport system permease protein